MLAYIPSWVEDETLYSWCSRWHLSFSPSTKTTGRKLFGVASAPKTWQFGESLSRFCLMTGGRLGDAKTVLYERTIFGSFLVLAGAERAQRVTEGVTPPSALLGAKRVQLGLRYCASCLVEHTKIHGIGLWRMPHQLPGASMCLQHGEPLRQKRERQQIWATPDSVNTETLIFNSPKELESGRLVSRTAEMIFRARTLDVSQMRASATKILCEAHRALDAKRLDFTKVHLDWSQSAIATCIGRSDGVYLGEGPWIGDVLRGRRSERNPAKWAMLVGYLCERGWVTPEAFFENISKTSESQEKLWKESDWIPLVVVDAFKRSSNVTEVAKILNVHDKTIAKWIREYPSIKSIAKSWLKK